MTVADFTQLAPLAFDAAPEQDDGLFRFGRFAGGRLELAVDGGSDAEERISVAVELLGFRPKSVLQQIRFQRRLIGTRRRRGLGVNDQT